MSSDALDGGARAGDRRRPVFPPGYFGMALPPMLLADRAFKMHGTTVKPFERPSHLVTGGVFAVSRHPMYLGMVLILGGFAVLLGTLTPFVVVLAFAVLLDVRFIRVGERMLAETFGDGWRLYRRRVRRWL